MAREGFAERLGTEMRQRPGALAEWINIERMYLEVLLGRDLEKVADECWEYLGTKPRQLAAEKPTQRLLEATKGTRIKRFVFASSP